MGILEINAISPFTSPVRITVYQLSFRQVFIYDDVMTNKIKLWIIDQKMLNSIVTKLEHKNSPLPPIRQKKNKNHVMWWHQGGYLEQLGEKKIEKRK